VRNCVSYRLWPRDESRRRTDERDPVSSLHSIRNHHTMQFYPSVARYSSCYIIREIELEFFDHATTRTIFTWLTKDSSKFNSDFVIYERFELMLGLLAARLEWRRWNARRTTRCTGLNHGEDIAGEYKNSESWTPRITKGDVGVIQGRAAAPSALPATTPTTGPFVSTEANLIVNTTVPEGTDTNVGWMFDTVEGAPPPTPVFDGSAYNISTFYTPPGGVEEIWTGPDSTDFCGIWSGFWIAGVIDSSVLGTYAARWTIQYGQSTQPDAPVDPTSGCGPDPFNMTTVEFTGNWEVVAL
ncbi:hypothetical protein C8R45DRAFT_1156718, partial [Mycena sanguinolenta]